MSRPLKQSTPTLLAPLFALALLVLLALLAGLQYRWTGEMSRADRERTRASLEAALGSLARDFDHEIASIAFALRPHSGRRWRQEEESIGAGLERWRQGAKYPGLVKNLFEASLEREGELALAQFSVQEERFLAVPWPVQFETLRQRLQEIPRRERRQGSGFSPFEDEIPALVLPGWIRSPERGLRGVGLAHVRTLIVELDRGVMVEEMLPDLAERHLPLTGDGPLDFHLALFDIDDGKLLYHRGVVPVEPRGDAEVELLRRPGRGEPGWFPEMAREIGEPEQRPPAEGRRRRPGLFPGRHGGAGAWRLVATHVRGSLDAAVERARRRNLAISFGILALLAVSVGVLLDSTRRSRRLARQQLEFVAGVTHELMTPLAALRSAGQNLADGVVTERQQVARYGSLIDREGRRLGDMVAQVLELAGMWSGQRSLVRRPVEVGALIDAALSDLQSELDAQGFEVEVEEAADLPALLGDEGALRRVLDNLLANAIKYAAQGAWIGISARALGRDVEIAVADHGAGIATSDLPHVFEPFRRGGEMAASAIPGSGLGLSLVKSVVEEHGGRVAVETSTQGTTFRLRLPTLPMEERESDGR